MDEVKMLYLSSLWETVEEYAYNPHTKWSVREDVNGWLVISPDNMIFNSEYCDTIEQAIDMADCAFIEEDGDIDE